MLILILGMRLLNIVVNLLMSFWQFVCVKMHRKFCKYEPVKYEIFPLSPVCIHRLSMVPRKTLVLDLDETLVHSQQNLIGPVAQPAEGYDFIIPVNLDQRRVYFSVRKRPHVDFFLSVIAQWYDLVIFTASLEGYGTAVADVLANGRPLFKRRFFRHDCTVYHGIYTKDLSKVCKDMNKVFIIDNSPQVYRWFPNNAIPIKSWIFDPMDNALLKLLPLLDALRFTKDVRSVLARNIHIHKLW